MKVADIPTETFYQMILDLRSEQWKAVSEYAGFDAGIDYDLIVLKKEGVKLKFEWDNWFDGTVQGPDLAVQQLCDRYKLKSRR